VFGDTAYNIPISSAKSMLGHTMGAASAIEALICALVIERGIIPPTINYDCPDPECDLDYVPNRPRQQKVKVALSNAFAFGGNCSALILKNCQA
jgi:3-oxoacyl-[acyl-carrier-protein] synthase II